ncbi:MAG: asparagine synthase (glutamine-hydrolyzing) [Planctomycetota bacterium]|jgi:asparagine synthase (glutamine-hydrolysing)
MCGILGIINTSNTQSSLTDSEVERMRDTLRRRGPDEAGLQRDRNWILAHRRLIVRDTSHAGDQPMSTPDGRYKLVYNGELYNDAELRQELLDLDAVAGGFQSRCDTETVLWAFATWGPEAFSKLRGMFAIAIYDQLENHLHLARDPLGIKPLYYHSTIGEFVFASEICAILEHPYITPEPNIAMASAYLSTLRSVLGSHTLFKDVFAVEPGERVLYNASNGSIYRRRFHAAQAVREDWIDFDEATEQAREVVEDSVNRHLTSDVPISALLSGGIDSSILSRIAQDQTNDLHTWCAGTPQAAAENEDFVFAREAAASIGTDHREVRIDQERFVRDWAWMVSELGMPLSTPNEVAIHAVCKDLNSHGRIVTISGEGADELFGGYDMSLQAAANFMRSDPNIPGGTYQLAATAWISPSIKSQLLNPEAWNQVSNDSFLHEHFEGLFKRCQAEAGEHATELDAHLRFLRHNNLTGLLQRLDTSSMLASVEGRTPFADVRVLDFADSLPMNVKFQDEGEFGNGGGSTAVATARGKLVLRQAWSNRLPASIAARPKQSFPIPFQGWMDSLTPVLERSVFSRELFAKDLRAELSGNPAGFWQCAWPMLNLALWGERWWG